MLIIKNSNASKLLSVLFVDSKIHREKKYSKYCWPCLFGRGILPNKETINFYFKEIILEKIFLSFYGNI